MNKVGVAPTAIKGSVLPPLDFAMAGGGTTSLRKLEMKTFGIGKAVKELLNGNTVSRTGWNGPDQWLRLQVPDENSDMSLPYIFIKTVQGHLVPWLASQTDILAIDWYLVE